MISKLKQYGMPRGNYEIKGITIHNTSNYKMTARELFDFLENENKTSQSCHFLVDDKEVIEVMPLDYIAWHTGVAYDFGNMHTIAIEICSNKDTRTYLEGQNKAIELIKDLMSRFNLTTKDLYFHNDFLRNVNCPSTIIQMYKSKNNFIKTFFTEE